MPDPAPCAEYDTFASLENFELAWKRVSHSLRYEVKDWLGNKAYGWRDSTAKYLEALIETLHNYQPATPSIVRRPKPDRSLREFAFMTMDDRLVYQAAGNIIIRNSYNEIIRLANAGAVYGNIPIDPELHSGFVFKRTFCSKHKDPTKRQIGQYDLFRHDVLSCRKQFLDDFESPWLIKTDIASFYPSVDHNKLFDLLEKCSWLSCRELRKLLSTCLGMWNGTQAGQGLPIGYEASDHLANLYLTPVDNALRGFYSKRYVDDIYIFIAEFEEAKYVISILDAALSDLNLKRNAAKTEFLCLRELDHKALEERLSRSLSFIAHERTNQESEIRRQKRLFELFFSGCERSENDQCAPSGWTSKDVRAVTFALYRLRSPHDSARDACFWLLDHSPNYALHALEYLTNNYAQDVEVVDRIRSYLTRDYEPSELKARCLIALTRMIGFRFVESELIEALQNPDWFLRYTVLRDLIYYNLENLSRNVIETIEKLAHDEANQFVQAYAMWVACRISANDPNQRQNIVNEAFSNNNIYLKKLGLYYRAAYNVADVEWSRLPHALRNRFLDRTTQDERVEFQEKLHSLFGILLPDGFPLERIFGNLTDALGELRTVWETADTGIDDFVSALYAFTTRFLNGVVRIKDNTHQDIQDLAALIRAHYMDTPADYNTSGLINDWNTINTQKKLLSNGRQNRLITTLNAVFVHFMSVPTVRIGVPMRNQVYISYSHEDNIWKDRVRTYLKPHFQDNSAIIVWDDKLIPVGTKLKDDLSSALQRARVAVLLVSSNFLASDFIRNDELPQIISAADNGDLRIVWIPIDRCAVDTTRIPEYQCAVTDPDRPLSMRSELDWGAALVQISEEIASISQT